MSAPFPVLTDSAAPVRAGETDGASARGLDAAARARQELLPAEQVDRAPATEEERAAILGLLYDQASEVVACLHKVTCPCGRNVGLVYAFKCLYCALWFCPTCAPRHFSSSGGGDRPAPDPTDGALDLRPATAQPTRPGGDYARVAVGPYPLTGVHGRLAPANLAIGEADAPQKGAGRGAPDAEAQRLGQDQGRAAERAACAELVRAAGCLCSELNPWTAPTGSRFACWDGGELEQHDDRCPAALAAAIEARG